MRLTGYICKALRLLVLRLLLIQLLPRSAAEALGMPTCTTRRLDEGVATKAFIPPPLLMAPPLPQLLAPSVSRNPGAEAWVQVVVILQ